MVILYKVMFLCILILHEYVFENLDEVNGFSEWPNPSSCNIAIGLREPLTKMSTKNLPCDKEWLACKADITTIYEPTL